MEDTSLIQPPQHLQHGHGLRDRVWERVSALFINMTIIEKIFFVQNLEVLVRAGFSLSHALTTVAKQAKRKKVKEILVTVAQQVEGGKTFADALRTYEKIFDPLFINMIESGELSGKLERTLKQLATQQKKSHQLYLKIRNALAYPAVILVAMICIGVGMMVFVIPKITDLYRGKEDILPWPTKVVIAVSDFIIHHGLLSILIIILVIVIVTLVYRQPNIHLKMHHALVRMPLFGTIIQEYYLARFGRVFHSLITTDIPIIQSFRIIANTMGNLAYKQLLTEAMPRLEKGESIASVLHRDDRLFPSTVTEIFTVGEASGALDELSNELAEHYEQEVSSALDGLSVLIEPVLMLFLGLGVGLIAVAVLWPMYNLVNVI